MPNVVSAHKRHKVAHTMGACEHGIISTDIIPVPNVVSAHKRHKVAHTMGACEHGTIKCIYRIIYTGRQEINYEFNCCSR